MVIAVVVVVTTICTCRNNNNNNNKGDNVKISSGYYENGNAGRIT